jgi:hypothetical protein
LERAYRVGTFTELGLPRRHQLNNYVLEALARELVWRPVDISPFGVDVRPNRQLESLDQSVISSTLTPANDFR